MTLLWTGMLVVSVLTCLAVGLPLYRASRWARARSRNASRDQVNLQLYRDRENELAAEMAVGQISSEQCEAMRQELRSTVLENLPDATADEVCSRPSADLALDEARPKSQVVRNRGRLLLVLLLGLPVLAVWLYSLNGAHREVEQRLRLDELRTLLQSATTLEEVEQKVAAELERAPADPSTQMLMAKVYLGAGKFAEAVDAAGKAAGLLAQRGDNPAAAYGLQASAGFQRDAALTESVRSAIDQALVYNSKEPNALSILGIAAFQAQRFEDAIVFWETALEDGAAGDQTALLQQGIAAARGRLATASGLGADPDVNNPATAARVDAPLDDVEGDKSASSPGVQSVRVFVDLSPEARAAVPAEAVVYVLARRPAGQGMPLAVLRTRADRLPAVLELDERAQMVPESSMASVPAFEIIARVSRSGTPAPVAGDWEGRSEVLQFGALPAPDASDGRHTSVTIDQPI